MAGEVQEPAEAVFKEVGEFLAFGKRHDGVVERRGEAGAHCVDLFAGFFGGSRRDDECHRGEGQFADAVLAEDAADDRKPFTQEAPVVMAFVERVQQFPRDHVMFAENREGADPAALFPELVLDGQWHGRFP
ncbi:hypothetical protein ACH4YO_32440 [Streptomyces noursei]|uniref:hypothetical protein n=1 Tax=Streptomyces noursei TaxID=1971 RepID=UPI00340FBE04